jgi:hypothetical protein
MKPVNVRPVFLSVITLLLLSAALFGACSGGIEEEPESEVLIHPAQIEEVGIRFAESDPPQVFVYIKGGLPDGCTTFHEINTERDGMTVNITVTTQRPADMECTAVYTTFEENVALGSDFVSGETYTVNVNDYTTTFTMQ